MILQIFCRRYSTHRLSIKQILQDKPLGACEVTGWIKSARKQKQISFLNINDGSSNCQLQVVIPSKKLSPDARHHSAVRVEGELKLSSHPGQELELEAQTVEVVNCCQEPYPIQPRKHFNQNFIRRLPSYKAKTNSVASLLRLRNHMNQEINKYFQDNGYIHIHTPVITSNDCEGGGEVFNVNYDLVKKLSDNDKSDHVKSENTVSADTPDRGVNKVDEYFDKQVYLTVSGQLHLEAICNGISKVYTFNPAFRAEKGRTRRHLSEFWMVEAEIAFIQDIDELLDIMETLIKQVAKSLIQDHAPDLATYAKSAQVEDPTQYIADMVSHDFHRITFQTARDMISEEGGQLEPVVDDLTREHELFLCERLGGPVFVYNWPKHCKPFYMRECEHDPDLVSCVDLLVPRVGELCGGSLREIDFNKLKSRVDNPELDWYIDMRSKGSAPTAGFGLGFERLIQWLVGVENIKDTIPFYRSSHDCLL